MASLSQGMKHKRVRKWALAVALLITTAVIRICMASVTNNSESRVDAEKRDTASNANFASLTFDFTTNNIRAQSQEIPNTALVNLSEGVVVNTSTINLEVVVKSFSLGMECQDVLRIRKKVKNDVPTNSTGFLNLIISLEQNQSSGIGSVKYEIKATNRPPHADELPHKN
jgi:hypothetical protein